MATHTIPVVIRAIPSDDTMEMCFAMLNLWQMANTDYMIALVHDGERIKYEIIKRDQFKEACKWLTE